VKDRDDRIHVEGLSEKTLLALRFDAVARVAGHEHHPDVGAEPAQLAGQLLAGHVGQIVVQQRDVRLDRIVTDDVERSGATGHRDDVVALGGEVHPQPPAGGGVVVHHEHRGLGSVVVGRRHDASVAP